MDLEAALARITELEGLLEKFKGIDPEQATRDRQTLTDQLANTQRQFNEFKVKTETEKTQLLSQITRRDIRTEFDKAFINSKGLAEYGDVLFQTAIAGDNLHLKDGTVMTRDGKPLTELLTTFQERYPAMFAAPAAGGSGATGSQTQSTPAGVKTVSPQNGVIAGVDAAAVIKGEVQIR
jgi:hypothetical protein